MLIHQANGKMDDAILERLYSLYGMEVPGRGDANDHLVVGQLVGGNRPHAARPYPARPPGPSRDQKGDTIVIASVGAGMNINAIAYKMA